MNVVVLIHGFIDVISINNQIKTIEKVYILHMYDYVCSSTAELTAVLLLQSLNSAAASLTREHCRQKQTHISYLFSQTHFGTQMPV